MSHTHTHTGKHFGVISPCFTSSVSRRFYFKTDFCFKTNLFSSTRDTFPVLNLIYELLKLRSRVTIATLNTCVCVYIYMFYIFIYFYVLYIYLKKLYLSLSPLWRTWKLGEVLPRYIHYILFIASRLFRAGGGEDIGVEGPHSSTLHFHKPGLVSLVHT